MSLVDRIAAALASPARRRGLVADPSRIGIGGFAIPMPERELSPAEQLRYIRLSNAVYSCATLRAKLLRRLPLKAYKIGAQTKRGVRRQPKVIDLSKRQARFGMPHYIRGKRIAELGEVTEVDNGDLVKLLRTVNPIWTLQRLIEHTELSLCLGGQSYWTLDRGKSGKAPPSAIYYVAHTRMKPRKHPTKILTGYIQDDMTNVRQEHEIDGAVWFRYPDPLDPDYGALSPLTAATLGGDIYRSAMKANRNIFRNGMIVGGFVMPPEGQEWTEEQMKAAEETWTKKTAGEDKSMRWLFMPEKYEVKGADMSPKDAEFLGALDFSIEDVGRAYGVPVEFIGGARRTYQNLENAGRHLWMFTEEPEACFIADELSEQMVPIFDGEVDFLAFDVSDVTELQEDEKERWARSKEQIQTGAKTINEWRADEGLDAVPWGDVAWLPGGLLPVDAAVNPMLMSGDEDDDTARSGRILDLTPRRIVRAVPEYGSRAHERLWRAQDQQMGRVEAVVDRCINDLLERQKESLIDRLGELERSSSAPRARVVLDDLEEAFNRNKWVRTFREEMRSCHLQVVQAAAANLFEELGAEDDFDDSDPQVLRFLRRQSQRFAVEVNDTTWEKLKASFEEGISDGEGLTKLAQRVEDVMEGRIRSDAETIARTETVGAWNGGSLLAAKQSGVASTKTWISSLDSRVRDNHKKAHGQTVAIDEDFSVGRCSGDAPGSLGCAEEDINCRCVMTYGLTTDRAARSLLEGMHAALATL